MANFVTGLGTPAGKLADATHRSILNKNCPNGQVLSEQSLACYDGLGKPLKCTSYFSYDQ